MAPELSVQPPLGVTGKPTYLTIGGKPTDDFTIWNPVDEEWIEIEASSVYEIDWGDRFQPGTNRTITESQGGPWPDGDVRHTYSTKDASVTITVTQRWTAVWFAGDEAGVIEDLVTEGAIQGYQVVGLEAVRMR